MAQKYMVNPVLLKSLERHGRDKQILGNVLGDYVNFGTRGAFEQKMPPNKQNPKEFIVKVIEPEQKHLKAWYEMGSQDLVIKVEEAPKETVANKALNKGNNNS